MAVAENFPIIDREELLEISDLSAPPTEKTDRDDLDGAVIPLTAPNFLGLISKGVRWTTGVQAFNHKDNPTGLAVMRGTHGKEDIIVPHTASNDSLVDYDNTMGDFVVRYDNSAFVADFLLGQEDVARLREAEGRRGSQRPIVLMDTSGDTHSDLQLKAVNERSREGSVMKHRAFFEGSPLADDNAIQSEEIDIDEIYSLSYQSPGKLALEKARAVSFARVKKTSLKSKLKKLTDRS
jgi:hypothetical protein